jgi:hypothetical protein
MEAAIIESEQDELQDAFADLQKIRKALTLDISRLALRSIA